MFFDSANAAYCLLKLPFVEHLVQHITLGQPLPNECWYDYPISQMGEWRLKKAAYLIHSHTTSQWQNRIEPRLNNKLVLLRKT